MKKHLIILTILVLSCIIGQGQTNIYHPLLGTNAFFGDKGWNIFNSSLYFNTHYGVNENIIINRENYKKKYSLFDLILTNPNSIYDAAIKEQNKRIYTIIGTFPEALYDLNLTISDTVTYNLSLVFYTVDTSSRVVIKIYSVLLLKGIGGVLVNGSVEYLEEGFGYTRELKWITDPEKFAPKNALRGSISGRLNICHEDISIRSGVVAINSKTNRNFMIYAIKALVDFISDGFKGSTFPSVTSEDLNNYLIPLSTTMEGEIEIVKLLNEETKTFDLAISKAQKEIYIIKECREALITDLVTGKQRVENTYTCSDSEYALAAEPVVRYCTGNGYNNGKDSTNNN